MTQSPNNELREEIAKLLGTAILENDKNYTNDIVQLFTYRLQALKDELPIHQHVYGILSSSNIGEENWNQGHNNAIDQVTALIDKAIKEMK